MNSNPGGHEAEAIDALTRQLRRMVRVGVAVSGGVDSLTISVIAHRALGSHAQMYHAVSPAVPAEATARVRETASRDGWKLQVFDAGEFEDAAYRANPVDRCLYCKRNLYAAIARQTDATIVTGTNLDDLGDYRPGLQAAAEREARHPFAEACIDKAGVRRIARALDLGELAELPAAPCLSSRVETGIAIEPSALSSIHSAEKLVQKALSPETVRCRVRSGSIVVELDPATLGSLTPELRDSLSERIGESFGNAGGSRPVEFQRYRMGSAFLR